MENSPDSAKPSLPRALVKLSQLEVIEATYVAGPGNITSVSQAP